MRIDSRGVRPGEVREYLAGFLRVPDESPHRFVCQAEGYAFGSQSLGYIRGEHVRCESPGRPFRIEGQRADRTGEH